MVKPRIAVLGLNPHAGDSGIIGKEETEIIKPAIAKVFSEDKLVYGPYPADSFFGSAQYRQFDAILAMYHDQGLIPFKTFAFYDGVNFTAGLPIVRTSPDHGTAYSLAGKGTAETLSFRNALYEAIHIVQNRKQYGEDYNNPLPYAELRREKFRIDF
jgi:4-hydroxythreonine-4-phosphate dehydrogenase